MQQGIGAKSYFRTLWLSDIHLGYRHCKAELLLEFLTSVRCETLYLVGDIVDLWSLKSQWHWPASHSAVMKLLLDMAGSGTRIVLVPGNHDELLRDFSDRSFSAIAIHKQFTHTTVCGRKLLVTHGDEFESFIRCSALTRVLGSASYSALLAVNRSYNRWRAWHGKPYWSLASHIKHRVGNARRAIESFEDAAIGYARTHGFDGIVCGHIHQPRMREQSGVLYCNDGDWVENCTAMAEHADGRLELLHWPDRQSRESAANEPAFAASAVATGN